MPKIPHRFAREISREVCEAVVRELSRHPQDGLTGEELRDRLSRYNRDRISTALGALQREPVRVEKAPHTGRGHRWKLIG
jgi:hypothetical protein